jgi:hypothetical protein
LEKSSAAEAQAAAEPKRAAEILSEAQTDIQTHVAKVWWELADELVVRYNDGFFNFGKYQPNSAGALPYPSWWLRMIGFDPDFYKPGQHWAKAAGPEAFNAAMNGVSLQPVKDNGHSWAYMFILAPVFFLWGFSQGRKRGMVAELREPLIL